MFAEEFWLDDLPVVLSGRFREDLFYRLSSIQIRIPSSAERLEDIPLLVQFFLKKYNHAYGKDIAGLTRWAQTVLLLHPWPGNVRELENVISTACFTVTGDFIDLSDLPEQLNHRTPRLAGDEDWQPLSLDEVRKVHIQKVLQMCNGNRLRTAQILGIGRTRRYGYLKRDGCDSPPRLRFNSTRSTPTWSAPSRPVRRLRTNGPVAEKSESLISVCGFQGSRSRGCFRLRRVYFRT